MRRSSGLIFLSIETPADSIIGRLPLILADIIVVLVTWKETFRVSLENLRFGFNFTVGAVLLRDGAHYCLAAVNHLTDALFDGRQRMFRVRLSTDDLGLKLC